MIPIDVIESTANELMAKAALPLRRLHRYRALVG